jgi:tetratricopeptide (TPR) repeat protein
VAIAAVPLCLALIVWIVTNQFYRWNTVTHEFSTGTFTSNFPIHAAAFAREAELPPKLYNDMTAGGYLTWEAPVPGGVFIDGRLEVYDTEFFSEYLSALSNPQAWRAQVDRYGVQTAILFHRWSNRYPLIRALASDSSWSLVYHDEVAVVLVRTQGNAQAIERARKLFPVWQERTRTRLAAPVSSWRFPVERVSSLVSYGSLLNLIGAYADANHVYEQALAFDLTTDDEVLVRTRVGIYLAQRGQRAGARVHLERAAKLDPENRRLQQYLAELGA